mgnify:CR=1 FL=1
MTVSADSTEGVCHLLPQLLRRQLAARRGVQRVLSLADRDAVISFLQDHAPTIRRLAREIDAVLAGFVRGQVSVCLVLGTYYAVALMLAVIWAWATATLAAALLARAASSSACWAEVARSASSALERALVRLATSSSV